MYGQTTFAQLTRQIKITLLDLITEVIPKWVTQNTAEMREIGQKYAKSGRNLMLFLLVDMILTSDGNS